MSKLLLSTLILVVGPVFAAEESCDGLVPLEKVKEICQVEFIPDKTSTRGSRCTANYIDKSMGSKHVGEVGISSELILRVNHRLSKEGTNIASKSFNAGRTAAMERGIFKKDVSDLGEGAYYSELDVHQTVTWYKGEYLYNFTVDKGKKNEEDWVAPCTPEQTIEIARAIGNQ